MQIRTIALYVRTGPSMFELTHAAIPLPNSTIPKHHPLVPTAKMLCERSMVYAGDLALEALPFRRF